VSESPELRRAALERAAAMRDPRVGEVLRRCVVVTHEREASAWESSEGTIQAIDVELLADGWALGLWESPAVRDAVVAALAAVAPGVVEGSVTDVSIVWALRERGAEAHYRGGAPERVDRGSKADVERSMAAFLDAGGSAPSAERIFGRR
jgi:hypothetical protein